MDKKAILDKLSEKYNIKRKSIKLISFNDLSETYKADNIVFKITTDLNKFLYAYKYKNIIGDKEVCGVCLFDLFLCGNTGIIVMEFCDQEGVKNLFDEADKIINDDKNIYESILDIEPELLKLQGCDVSPDLTRFIEDIYKSAISWSKLDMDINNLTVQPENIGKNTEGRYILFNQKNDMCDNNMLEEFLNEIRDDIKTLD